MNKAHHFAKQHVEEIIRKYRDGQSITSLAKDYKVDRTTIRWHIRRDGVVPAPRPTPAMERKVIPLPLPIAPRLPAKPQKAEWHPKLPGKRLPDDPRVLCSQCYERPAVQLMAPLPDGTEKHIQMRCIPCMQENHTKGT